MQTQSDIRSNSWCMSAGYPIRPISTSAYASVWTDLGKRGITCIAIHPGWVETDMGGKGASLSPQESAGRLLETFEAIGSERSGSYLDTDGSTLPW